MGSGTSKEVMLAANPHASSAVAQSQVDAAVAHDRDLKAAAAAYRDAEDRIFQAGYKRGSEDALNRIDDEVERHARAAYAHTALEEEAKIGAAVETEAARLSKSFYKAPQRPVECQAEEGAVLACDPEATPGTPGKIMCGPALRAYQQCAEKQLGSLMRPKLQ